MARPHSSSDHNNGQDHRPRRCPRRHCRIASFEAPVAGPEPFSKEGPEAAGLGPSPVGSECDTRVTSAHRESRDRDQARDAVAILPSPGPTKISMAVFRENHEAARTQGTVKGTDCRGLEIKRLNPRFGCPRIAQQISLAFGLEIDKDVVRRILANHPPPKSGGKGPSWLSIIAEPRDSLWNVDLFRRESVLLKTFWVMVVMDIYTRRIVGFGVEPAHIDGIGACRMFNHARRGQPLPKRLSSDHDPLFRFHRWRAASSRHRGNQVCSVRASRQLLRNQHFAIVRQFPIN